MRVFFVTCVLTVVTVVFTPSMVAAQMVTYEFAGTLQESFGTHPVGTPFTGSLTYDASQADRTPTLDRGDFPYTNVTLRIGTDVASDNGTGVINLYDDGFYPTDLFHLYTFNISGVVGGLTLAPGAGLQVVLQDVTGAAFSGASVLPGPELVVTSFTGDGATFIELRSDDHEEFARGWLTTLTAATPEANAGADQTANEFAAVTLDGSQSIGVLSSPITAYSWNQVAGTAVTLTLADPTRPSFTTPSVPRGGETLTFRLTVTSASITSDPDVVNVTVVNVNHRPVAIADADTTAVREGAPVELTGAASFDEDAEALTYFWTQIAGPTVVLSDAGAVEPTFSAPLVSEAGATLSFRLTVSDGEATHSDEISIVVENVNHAPVADAGASQAVNEGATVTLDAGASVDPDDDLLSFFWEQVGGAPIHLSDPTAASPTFVAAGVDAGGSLLVFQLTVYDGFVSATDTVEVLIQNVNDPPACDLARPTQAVLWPPDHKLVPIGIVGISDPNNDPTTFAIHSVTQDEPTDGLGDGDTGPDAVVQEYSILLRAERSGNDNGRVYRIVFMATDGNGGSCGGTIRVSVPHKPKVPAIEDAVSFNSTVP